MNKRLRGALIGYGFIMEKGHVPAYKNRAATLEDIEIIGVADICAQRLERVGSAFPEAKTYADPNELLRELAPELDFVDIATPPANHFELSMTALELGLHVLCEKPLVTTTEEASALLTKATEVERVLFPCHNYKHAPVVKAIQGEIDSGRLGKIQGLTLNTFRSTHAKGVSEWKTDWRREFRYSGGGIAMDHGSHTFYLTFDWFGEYPTTITAKMDNRSQGKFDTEDNFSAVLSFPSGLANVHLTWTAGVRKVIYAVQGTKGAVTVDDDQFERALMQTEEGKTTWQTEKRSISSDWMDASHVTWFNSLFDSFKLAIEKDDFVGKEACDAFACVEIINKAYQSAKEGCRELPLSAQFKK